MMTEKKHTTARPIGCPAPLTELAAWRALQAHYRKVRKLHLRKLFGDDPKRGEHMAFEAAGIYFDYSKHRITDETLMLLMQLAEESGLRARIDAMLCGNKINATEKRAVLHVALRTPKGQSLFVEGRDIMPNMPVLMRLLGLWYNNFSDTPRHDSSTNALIRRCRRSKEPLQPLQSMHR
jgi:hypothetical protein